MNIYKEEIVFYREKCVWKLMDDLTGCYKLMCRLNNIFLYKNVVSSFIYCPFCGRKLYITE